MIDFDEALKKMHNVSEDIRSYMLKINEYYDETDDIENKKRCRSIFSNLTWVMSTIESICSNVFEKGTRKRNNPCILGFYFLRAARCLESKEHRDADPEKYDDWTDTLFVELEIEALDKRYSWADYLRADDIPFVACFKCTLKARVGNDNDVEHMTFRVDDEGVYYIKDDCWEPTLDKYNYSVRYDPNDPKTFVEEDIEKMFRIKEYIHKLSYGHSVIDNRPIEKLDFPNTLLCKLKRFGVKTICDFKDIDIDELNAMPGVGRKSIRKIIMIAHEHGIHFDSSTEMKYL